MGKLTVRALRVMLAVVLVGRFRYSGVRNWAMRPMPPARPGHGATGGTEGRSLRPRGYSVASFW